MITSIFFRIILPRSVKARLIWAIALVHAILMTVFIGDMVYRQRVFLQQETLSRAFGLTRMTAVNSASWVFAEDIQGLTEVMQGVRSYPDLLYAMVVDRELRILAHTEDHRIDMRLADEISQQLVSANPEDRILLYNDDILDVAVPIRLDDTVIGWSRIGLNMRLQAKQLSVLLFNGAVYVVIAVVLGIFFAFLVGKRLTSEVSHLAQEADRLRQGERRLTPLIHPTIEMARLERNFVSMAQTIWKREDDLARERDHLEEKVAYRTSELRAEVDERRAVEANLIAEKERAESALREKDKALTEQRNFLSMVSHEFRTPLGIISGSASILSEFITSPDETSIGRAHSHIGAST